MALTYPAATCSIRRVADPVTPPSTPMLHRRAMTVTETDRAHGGANAARDVDGFAVDPERHLLHLGPVGEAVHELRDGDPLLRPAELGEGIGEVDGGRRAVDVDADHRVHLDQDALQPERHLDL
jgi:hypothetical protein